MAGWSYADWKGVLYPQPAPRGFDPLAYLARYVDAIEINSTFYRPPKRTTAEKWVRRVETHPAFCFTAKLWRRFTHERGSAWTKKEARDTKAGLRPLLRSRRLGALLLQFPWSFRRTEENREWLGDVANEFAEFPLVLEVRHASWNVPELYASLADQGIGFVNIDQPLFRNSIKPSATATSRIGYVRLHGRNYKDWFRKGAGRDARYDYLYPPDELQDWVDRAEEVAQDPETGEVFVVANNHYKAQAVVNAIQAKSMATGAKQPAPAPLLDSYPDALAAYTTEEESDE